MILPTTSPAHRAAEKLISSKSTCSCDEAKALREKIATALMLLRGGFVERARGVLEGET